jgi:hypothetical protein
VSTERRVPLDSLDKLEAALLEMQQAYEETADRAARQAMRSLLIAAKTKARSASLKAKSEAKRAEKAEMANWILTWLENPPVFAEWVKLRREVISARSR